MFSSVTFFLNATTVNHFWEDWWWKIYKMHLVQQCGDKSLVTPEAGLYPKICSVFGGTRGVLHCELLLNNQTIDSNKYCLLLDVLQAAIKKCPVLENRISTVFHEDNTSPYVSLKTQQKLLEYGWYVLPHPEHYLDIAPSDYHLFWSLQNSLNDTRFDSLDQIKHYLAQFFNQKSVKFCEDKIFSLHDR